MRLNRSLCGCLVYVMLLLALAYGIRSSVGHLQGLKFAFSSDIHFGCNDSEELFASYVDTWRRQLAAVDFLVIAGDLTCDGAEKEFLALRDHLKTLKKRVYTLPGNHDLVLENVSDDRFYKRYFGYPAGSYYREHNGIGFLFLDLGDGGRATVTVHDSVAAWLVKKMSTVSIATPVIVFSHYPLHPETPCYAVRKSDLLFATLDQKNIIGYFSGHYHGWWTGQRNGVPFYTVGPLMPSTDNFDGSDKHGYYKVRVMGNELKVEYVALVSTKKHSREER
jgi:calcineurin-like phosphoesterase family protein